jgi:hypothetical protein
MTSENNSSSIKNSNESTQNLKKPSLGQQDQLVPSTEEPARNKGGRPKGAKNTLTLLQEAAQKGIMSKVLNRFDSIVETTIKKAEEGDPTCLKILWDRTVPIQKSVDGSAKSSNSGITIVVQGTKITQQENSTIEEVQYEEIIEDESKSNTT